MSAITRPSLQGRAHCFSTVAAVLAASILLTFLVGYDGGDASRMTRSREFTPGLPFCYVWMNLHTGDPSPAQTDPPRIDIERARAVASDAVESAPPEISAEIRAIAAFWNEVSLQFQVAGADQARLNDSQVRAAFDRVRPAYERAQSWFAGHCRALLVPRP